MKTESTAVFLRKRGLNHGFKLEGSNFKGTLIDLLNELKAQQQVKNYNSLDNVVQQSELLIGLLTMLEKEGGNNFIDKAEIVAKYQANL